MFYFQYFQGRAKDHLDWASTGMASMDVDRAYWVQPSDDPGKPTGGPLFAMTWDFQTVAWF